MTADTTELAMIGRSAPDWMVSDWVQGEARNLRDYRGRLVLIEVFQVNCPGCFLYALPRAIDLDRRYRERGLVVIGLATAFEDFDLNTVDNLRLLVEEGRVVGETLRTLNERNVLRNGCWPFRLDVPLAMDRLIDDPADDSDSAVDAFIAANAEGFAAMASDLQRTMRERVRRYLRDRQRRPQTFERYRMQGTPTQILIDADGVLRQSCFGHYPELEKDVARWLPG
jgi:hypothetical protein